MQNLQNEIDNILSSSGGEPNLNSSNPSDSGQSPKIGNQSIATQNPSTSITKENQPTTIINHNPTPNPVPVEENTIDNQGKSNVISPENTPGFESEVYSPNRKKIIIAVVVVVVLLIAGYLIFQITGPQTYKSCIKDSESEINNVAPAYCINKNGKVFYKDKNEIERLRESEGSQEVDPNNSAREI